MRYEEPDTLLSLPLERSLKQTRDPARTGRRQPLTILSISATVEDHRGLGRILDDQLWQIADAGTFRQAINCLCKNRPAVIICESKLPDGTWRELLSYVAGLTDSPALIVTSTEATEHLAAEVHDLGGFGVLPKPFNPEEVNCMLNGAIQQRTAAAGG